MNQLMYLLFATVLLAGCSKKMTDNVVPEADMVTGTETEAAEHEMPLPAWSYTGDTGPDAWGELDESYASCVNGSEQSPINIEFSQVETQKTIENVETQYEPATFSMINNGHTIQVNSTTENNKMLLDETEYQLVQYHFHTPSEHQFNGKQYAMELHLVHQNDAGELAVLGLMIQEGTANEQLQSVWEAMPKEKTEEEIAVSGDINLQELLPEDQSFLYYNGSLTTPPCTEEVKWVIYEQPIEMSKEQIEAFQQIFPHHNHRPVQPLNEREVIKN